jgi:uncharacterized protein YndB with AHSA1/START domain
MWQRSFSIVASAPAAAVWRLFEDVEGWKAWNAGIESISMHGPFAEGTHFAMKPPGQEAFTSRLVKVVPQRRFADETVVADVRVFVDHEVERTSAAQSRITYTATVTGPGAAEIGAAVTDDFPAVLEALAARAEREAART